MSKQLRCWIGHLEHSQEQPKGFELRLLEIPHMQPGQTNTNAGLIVTLHMGAYFAKQSTLLNESGKPDEVMIAAMDAGLGPEASLFMPSVDVRYGLSSDTAGTAVKNYGVDSSHLAPSCCAKLL